VGHAVGTNLAYLVCGRKKPEEDVDRMRFDHDPLDVPLHQFAITGVRRLLSSSAAI